MQHRPHLTRALVAFTVLSLLAAAVLLILDVVPALQLTPVTSLAAALIPYGVLAWACAALAGLVLVAVARTRGAGLLTAAIIAGLVTATVRLLPPTASPPPSTMTLRLLSANTLYGTADPASLTHLATRADVVVLIETTTVLTTALEGTDFLTQFPYHVGRPGDAASGTMIYSRYPIDEVGRAASTYEQWLGRVHLPDGGTVVVAAAHPINPLKSTRGWNADAAALMEATKPFLHEPVIVAGDFNAIDQHVTMRPFRAAGLRSASGLTGRWPARSWPTNKAYPPLFAIDHILLSPHLGVRSLRAVDLPRSDHAALIAEIGPA